MNKWEQFSHTTRTFLPDPVDQDLIDWITEIVDKHKEDLASYKIITDPEVIESIYQLTDIPDESAAGIRYIKRKNSQVLSPCLVVLIPNEVLPKSNYTAGYLQSQIGLKAIASGYNTGFCICFDSKALRKILEQIDGQQQPFISCTTILFSIGKKDTSVPHNFSKRDNVMVKSPARAKENNVTIIDPTN